MRMWKETWQSDHLPYRRHGWYTHLWNFLNPQFDTLREAVQAFPFVSTTCHEKGSFWKIFYFSYLFPPILRGSIPKHRVLLICREGISATCMKYRFREKPPFCCSYEVLQLLWWGQYLPQRAWADHALRRKLALQPLGRRSGLTLDCRYAISLPIAQSWYSTGWLGISTTYFHWRWPTGHLQSLLRWQGLSFETIRSFLLGTHLMA